MVFRRQLPSPVWRSSEPRCVSASTTWRPRPAFYERLTGTPPLRFERGGVSVAAVGCFLLMSGPESELEILRKVTATIAVEDVDAAHSTLTAVGATVAGGPGADPGGPQSHRGPPGRVGVRVRRPEGRARAVRRSAPTARRAPPPRSGPHRRSPCPPPRSGLPGRPLTRASGAAASGSRSGRAAGRRSGSAQTSSRISAPSRRSATSKPSSKTARAAAAVALREEQPGLQQPEAATVADRGPQPVLDRAGGRGTVRCRGGPRAPRGPSAAVAAVQASPSSRRSAHRSSKASAYRSAARSGWPPSRSATARQRSSGQREGASPSPRSQLRTAWARSPACHWATPRWYSVSGFGGCGLQHVAPVRGDEGGAGRGDPARRGQDAGLQQLQPGRLLLAERGLVEGGTGQLVARAQHLERAPAGAGGEPLARFGVGVRPPRLVRGVDVRARQHGRQRAPRPSARAAPQSSPCTAAGSAASGPYASSQLNSAPASSRTCSSWVRASPAWISA